MTNEEQHVWLASECIRLNGILLNDPVMNEDGGISHKLNRDKIVAALEVVILAREFFGEEEGKISKVYAKIRDRLAIIYSEKSQQISH